MKARNILAVVLSAAYAAVANGEITAPTAMPIQRTLNALEKSTAANPARVRMLFYGQSIVEQGWHTNIVRQLKERYPTAILEVENRAIGGFTSPTEKYEAIIRKVRETTTAEIVLWTSHLDKKEAESRESIEGLLAEPDTRSKAIKDIAARYGCLFVDLRKKWCRMMLDTGTGCDVLLMDGIHMRPDGPAFGYYSNFIAEELVRIPETNGEPKFSGTITEIPVTDSRVKSAADGSLRLEFEGNRVVAVSDNIPTCISRRGRRRFFRGCR